MHKKIISATAFLLFTAASAFAWNVPDTGQTGSYTNTFGEDSDYTCNPHSYTDPGNGIILDNVTGLMWQKATEPGTYTWSQAITYCDNLVLGGYSDWRLPNVNNATLSYILQVSRI